MKIIPAIDLIDGQCVRLQQGDYTKKTVYSADPLEVAQGFEAVGIRHLHLVDLDGAKKGSGVNHQVLERLAQETNLEIDFGGGLRTLDDFKRIFDLGAHKATVGSVSVSDPATVEQVKAVFGAERIILGADHRDGQIATHGWLQGGGVALEDHLIRYLVMGIDQVICTDIARDGMLQGPSIEHYRELLARFDGLRLIASGGVSSMEDLVALAEIGCEGAIVGKALYEGAIVLKELSNYIKTHTNAH